ncbi:hypothetical protein Droror1_Dr00018217 [Drosera rotundifolia]
MDPNKSYKLDSRPTQSKHRDGLLIYRKNGHASAVRRSPNPILAASPVVHKHRKHLESMPRIDILEIELLQDPRFDTASPYTISINSKLLYGIDGRGLNRVWGGEGRERRIERERERGW